MQVPVAVLRAAAIADQVRNLRATTAWRRSDQPRRVRKAPAINHLAVETQKPV
jgi:hypothetical protein